jgi:hypothetical protein
VRRIGPFLSAVELASLDSLGFLNLPGHVELEGDVSVRGVKALDSGQDVGLADVPLFKKFKGKEEGNRE